MRTKRLIAMAILASWMGISVAAGQELELAPTIEFTMDDGSTFGQVFTLMSVELPADTVSLMQMNRIQDELELVEDQRERLAERIKRLTEDYQKNMQAIENKLKESPQLEEERQKLSEKFRKDLEKATEEILLPFQVERLKQIRLQAEIRNRGARGIDSDAFAEWLQLTDEQKEELQKKSAEMEIRLKQEINELKAKRYREVFEDVLTKPQLKMLDERLGKPLPEVAKKSDSD